MYISDEKVKDTVPYNKGCNKSELYLARKRLKLTQKGAIIVGELEVDLSYLKDQELVQEQRRADKSPKYWRVDYDLEMVVEGLNLKFHVRWPQGGGEVQGKTGQIPLTAVFKPGTA